MPKKLSTIDYRLETKILNSEHLGQKTNKTEFFI